MEVKLYQPASREDIKKTLSFLNRSLEELDQAVQAVKVWLQTQKHLPEEPSNRMIEFFLVITEFDFELLKEKIENYYTYRTQIPDLFALSNPRLQSMQDTLKITKIISLPKLVNYTEHVMVFKIASPNVPDNFDANSWLAAIINLHEVFMQQSVGIYGAIIYDLENLSFSQVLKTSPSFVMNSLKIMEKVFNDKIRCLHVINYPSIFNVILTLCKSIMKKSVFDKFILHDGIESLAKHVPLNVLPKDYGGEEKSVDELEVFWNAKLVEYQNRFDKLDTLKVDETLRSTPLYKEPEGIFDSFSKLLFNK